MKVISQDEQLSHAHKVGLEWAAFLNLKKSRTHSDRFQMSGGEKTAIGVYHTVKRLVAEEGGEGLLK